MLCHGKRSMIPRYVGAKRKSSLTTPTIDENRGLDMGAVSAQSGRCPHRNVEEISELDLILSGEFLVELQNCPETRSEPGATPPNRCQHFSIIMNQFYFLTADAYHLVYFFHSSAHCGCTPALMLCFHQFLVHLFAHSSQFIHLHTYTLAHTSKDTQSFGQLC